MPVPIVHWTSQRKSSNVKEGLAATRITKSYFCNGAKMAQFREKRAYEAQTPDDGLRVYVDRLWPRGLSHANFHYDLWAKEIAPSTELRHWFHEDPSNRWDEFARKYALELENNPAVPKFEELIAPHSVVTLLYSSKESEHNNATVLQNFLEKRLAQPKSTAE